ncbi:MAG: hypothetical protein MZV64_34975 [Ignavibacteriales bacterium]|nr:hypothetical protein [Ignavibacteriales bacterium]
MGAEVAAERGARRLRHETCEPPPEEFDRAGAPVRAASAGIRGRQAWASRRRSRG